MPVPVRVRILLGTPAAFAPATGRDVPEIPIALDYFVLRAAGMGSPVLEVLPALRGAERPPDPEEAPEVLFAVESGRPLILPLGSTDLGKLPLELGPSVASWTLGGSSSTAGSFDFVSFIILPPYAVGVSFTRGEGDGSSLTICGDEAAVGSDCLGAIVSTGGSGGSSTTFGSISGD